jgi:hypothetical protein
MKKPIFAVVGALLLMSSSTRALAQDDGTWQMCAQRGLIPKNILETGPGATIYDRMCKACPGTGQVPDVKNKTCKCPDGLVFHAPSNACVQVGRGAPGPSGAPIRKQN